jgi:pyruvate/2-oxoglutarate dehydrogenase complex dihydrolipoamide acyltransferase (E2) component
MDKATIEMQALSSGFPQKILVSEGERVSAGRVIAIIGEAHEDISGTEGNANAAAPALKAPEGLFRRILRML